MSYKNCKCKAGQCPPVPEGRDALVRQRYGSGPTLIYRAGFVPKRRIFKVR